MAVKSKNRTNVFINKNSVIVVLQNPNQNNIKKSKITTANKLSNYILHSLYVSKNDAQTY